MSEPTDEQLQRIRDWPYTDQRGWFDFIRDVWNHGFGSITYTTGALPDCKPEFVPIRIVTGGWSDNEAIISAMSDNTMLWSLTWQTSARGGAYTFDLSKTHRGLPDDPLNEVFREAVAAACWPVEPLTIDNAKVFAVNDCDWVAAPSLDAAVRWYVNETAGQFGSYVECIQEPVAECALDTECWTEMGNWEAGKTTYRAIIERHLAAGNTQPFVVASTEY